MATRHALVLKNRVGAGPAFGLCTFHGVLGSGDVDESSTLAVRCGAHHARFPLADATIRQADGTHALTVHVNTHLLQDGPQELHVTLEGGTGIHVTCPVTRFTVRNAGALASHVAHALRQGGAPVFIARHVDSLHFPFSMAGVEPWFDMQGMVDPPPMSMEPATDDEAARRHMQAWGFCVLGSTLPEAMLQGINREIDEAIRSGRWHHEAGSSARIHGAHLLPFGRSVWLYPPVIQFLRDWFRDEPAACQTLLFMNGSEQSVHQDTIHLTPFPSGYMCGVWIALEDVKPGSGELVVLPGSHRTPRITGASLGLAKVTNDYSSFDVFSRRIDELVAAGGYERVTYRPKAGRILVWHENLIHGGSRRAQRELTRRSIVSHYFARGAVAFYDSRGEAATLEPVG